MKRFALSLLGGLIFLAGILLLLSLSGGVLWGELEANTYTSQIGDVRLSVNCPFVLSPSESGIVSATITNTLNEDTSPMVTAEISRVDGEQQFSQTLTLAAHQSQTLHWTVDPSEIIFGRLILVNIIQSRYADLQSSQGACGILILSLFGLDGIQTFIFIFLATVVIILLGAQTWLRVNWPLNDLSRSTAQASLILIGFATAGILASLPRWWGLIMIFDFIALILLAVILTEFVLFPRRGRR